MPENLHQLMDAMDTGSPPLESAGIFGLDIPPHLANIHLLTIPWEVTTSFGGGTSKAPEILRKSSHQLDLFDHSFGETYKAGICYSPVPGAEDLNQKIHPLAQQVIADWEGGRQPKPETLQKINQASEDLNQKVKAEAQKILRSGKKLGIVGGDHSVPFGAFQALAEQDSFGILHVDAHHDLREAYEGFTHSHASIFYNTLQQIPEVTKLVSVGIRDYCIDEKQYAESQDQRVTTYYDEDVADLLAQGEAFAIIASEIVGHLPDKVHISFDIDGLSPELTPHTGTPVPGGLSFQQAVYLLKEVKRQNKQLIGFDLVEVGNDPLDGNVGARILYKLCGLFGLHT